MMQKELAGKLFLFSIMLFLLLAQGALLAQPMSDEEAFVACMGCGGFFFFVFLVLVVLHIALLVWVARDAKARGMDSAVLWMILVMVTGIIGFLIYIFSRPQGNLVQCNHCKNKRLQASAKCPHCGND